MKVVLDAGPIIHLEQIEALHVLNFIDNKVICPTVESEVDEPSQRLDFDIRKLNGESKDKAKYFMNRYDIEMGEASALALCQQEEIQLLLTDDLDARDAARKLELEPHGTLGIITKAYTKQIISKTEAKNLIKSLRDNSSLYITSDLVQWAVNRIEES